uniref:Uncharacterized protein n=1 Tax=Rhipicephalus appendiculatus TaxID=34631 RepID=A0A131YDB3_RHIAP
MEKKMSSEDGVQLFVTRFSKRLRATLSPQTGQTQSRGLAGWEGCRGSEILKYFFTGAPYYVCLSISLCLGPASAVLSRGRIRSARQGRGGCARMVIRRTVLCVHHS